ncbi:cyclin-dependent kinase inhibitor 1-like [Parasteatoda tepidariorum]|uniref:cyclin-dependent kinase inhibitor 1-like n=1 Tax=Parasteatoda tepidariorum TaxID=114398 RepID=UPI0039BCC9DC
MGDVTAVGALSGPTPRTNARWPVRSVKRCLFGIPDPEELRTHLEKETLQQYEKNKQKWNFDFVAEMPLDCGQYSWKKIRRDDDLSDKSGSTTETSSCEDIVVEQKLITDYMRKRKLSTNQATTSKGESKAKRRFST